MDYKALDKEYIANTYGRFPVCFVGGQGSLLYDEQGKEYIDFGSGIGVTSFGVNDPIWDEAVVNQVHQLNHVSNLYYTLPQIELAQKLCEKTGMKKVFFSNSGAEANECAIKAARKYSIDKYGKERNVIITLVNSFHGRTVTTLAATGQDVFHQYFYPFTEGFIHVPANDIEALQAIVEDNPNICAIMFEPIQGEGGVMPLEQDFVNAIVACAKEKDLLVVVDEVQTGNGRTGKMYGYMNFGIHPDIVSTAKGLAGGLPMGATLFSEKTSSVLDAGSHATTFGGNPICAAGGVSVVNRLTDEFLEEVQQKGIYIQKELMGTSGVTSVSGMGLMVGIEIEGEPKEIILSCLEKGLVVLSAKNKVRLLPALNIPFEVLEKGVSILKEVLEEHRS